MLNWLQTNWQKISDFYGGSFVYNVKNMVSVENRASSKETSYLQVVGAGEQGSSDEDLLQLQSLLDQHRDELGSSVKAVEQVLKTPSFKICLFIVKSKRQWMKWRPTSYGWSSIWMQ